MHEIIPVMKDEHKGVILNVCSVAAAIGIADRFAYSMTKGASYRMTISVAKDYLSYNIRCNSISPASVHTPFVDGYFQKNFPGKKKKCLTHCQRPSLSAEWERRRKSQALFYISAAMKRPLLRAAIT